MADSWRMLRERIEARAMKGRPAGVIHDQVAVYQSPGQAPAAHQDNGRILDISKEAIIGTETAVIGRMLT